jgi:hypothetical protein
MSKRAYGWPASITPAAASFSWRWSITVAACWKHLRDHVAMRHLLRKTDLDAILVALRPRVSCNRDLGVFKDSVNQGVGLTTVSRIAEHAQGRLVVVSGRGLHDPLGGSRRLAHGARWRGVAIALECRRDALTERELPGIVAAPR